MSKRTLSGPSHPLFVDGRTKDGNGYVVLQSKVFGKNAGRREHRVVMETVLGRPLKPHEIVHHINGIKHDNRPQNLAVETRQSHMRAHGEGQLMTCSVCGKQKWYQPALARKLAAVYQCRPCFTRKKK